ncbi:MAG: 3-hydroxybutyrate dehydrogenase [Alphaproteobacteria bacterium]
MSLIEKTALITGSTSGIGLAIANALAADGANIMLHGLGDKTQNQKLAKGLSDEHGVKAHYSDADISTAAQTYQLVNDTKNIFGSVDILVNNAGIQRVHSAESFPDEDWQAIINVNLSANFYAIKASLPLMREAGWGRIINIASVHGLVGSAQKAAYVAAKHGVIGLNKVIALETAEEAITCNAICPGWTRTDLIEPQIAARGAAIGATSDEQAVKALLQEKQPSCTMVQPADIGGLALFLCSDAAAQMTGASLPIDGGWTAQ